MDKPINQGSGIREFFKNSTVFITGGTGFLGLILLDKLIRCCPDIKTIYLLIRADKNGSSENRVASIFDNAVFDQLKAECPNYMDKITVINGDCSQPNLGLSNADKDLLIEKINVVVHMAATVRFDAPLREAVVINIRATRDLLLIAKNMKQLKAFVHLSTAYANCVEREFVEEKFYKSPTTSEALLSLIECYKDDTLQRITPGLIEPWPNTYTFTKAVSEGVVKRLGEGLPVTIVRPAIVTGKCKDPESGWTNNWNGPNKLAFGAGVGLVRAAHVDNECICELVPCDYVANIVISAAWYAAKVRYVNSRQPLPEDALFQSDHNSGITIFHYVSSNVNPFKWKDFIRFSEIAFSKIPPMSSKGIFSFKANKNKTVNTVYCFFLHLVPAAIIDTCYRIVGKKPRLWKVYEKMHKCSQTVSYFCTNQWKFVDNNTKQLFGIMSEEDRETFDFDLSKLDWEKYCYDLTKGIRIHLLKDGLETVPEAKKIRKRLLIEHYITVVCLWSILLYILFKLISFLSF